MQKFNDKILWNYKPSDETYKLALLVSEKLGKLNVRLQMVFHDYKKASRVFAFIESKYSSKIEGIYTTLFDTVNTGIETNQQKIIKPLVDQLFASKKPLSFKEVKSLAKTMNFETSSDLRWTKEFGVYKQANDNKQKIYEPPKNKTIVEELLQKIILKTNNDNNIIDILHSHILFEKIHPFVDANGRIGRLILQKSLTRLTNFANVLPLSWAFFTFKQNYYESFDIISANDVDTSVQKLLKIVLKMYQATKKFSIQVGKFIKKYEALVLNSSRVVTRDIAQDILLTLQTKSLYLQKTYSLNSRTIDKIFDTINLQLPFNRKIANRNIAYWNLELEEIIDHVYHE